MVDHVCLLALTCRASNPVLPPCLDYVGVPFRQAATRESWNRFVMAVKSAHREELSDVLRFLTQWCGAPQNPSYSFN